MLTRGVGMSRLSNIIASFFAQARMDDEATLDVGCGTGTFGIVLTAVRRTNKPYLVGIDLYEPYLFMIPANIYDAIVQACATHLPFRSKCFNNVVSIAVIEHLEKYNGYKMIEEMERVAKKLVVIMTSKGFIPKNADDNPFQRHRSGWDSKEFRRRNYNVRFLPDFGDIKWVLFPFILIHRLGLNAKLIMAYKHQNNR